MNYVLVTGSSGFVGRALVEELRRRGIAVRGCVRRRVSSVIDEDVVEVGEFSASTEWSETLRGIDTVFHLAARVHEVGMGDADAEPAYRHVNAEATAALGRAAAAAGVRRFVFASSVKVMGAASPVRPFDETDRPQPQDAYGRSKLEAEAALDELDGPMEITIVRPPLVYGPGVRANFLSLLKLAAAGWPLPLGAAKAPRSMIYIGNLVDALIACATVPHRSPAVYFVSDGRDLSVAELVAALRTEMGLPPRLWPVPTPLARASARLLGRADAARRLFTPLQVNTAKIRSDLGWSAPFSPSDGLRATVRWFAETRARARN